MHPKVVTCTCNSDITCTVPHGFWLGASARFQAGVPLFGPYPHVCRAALPAQRRDCAACATEQRQQQTAQPLVRHAAGGLIEYVPGHAYEDGRWESIS